jgi:probable rRNA maturation factor
MFTAPKNALTMSANPNHPRRRDPKRAPTAIENRQRTISLNLHLFERFLGRLCRELALRPNTTFIRFVTDAEMKRLNFTYRKKRKTTDVLSFPSDHRSRPKSLRTRANDLRGTFLGDIAISPTVARRNAKSFARTLEQEICILILHGFLHLLGYDHETDRGEMERVELKLRRRLGLH